MAPTQKPGDEKAKRLKEYGAFNPHPERVTEDMFSDPKFDFFDPHDLVQVKYEMLRAVDKEGKSVKQASEAYGFSRPALSGAISV